MIFRFKVCLLKGTVAREGRGFCFIYAVNAQRGEMSH